MAGLLASIVLGSCKHKRKSHEALKVHPQACYSVPSARTQGGRCNESLRVCEESVALTKHLLTKKKLTSGAAGKVWYQECLGFRDTGKDCLRA